MKKDIEKYKALFESISCLCCEGPEFMTKMELMSAIGKDAGKGYDLCMRHLSAHAADAEKVDDESACGREGGAAPYRLKPFHYDTAG